MTYFDPVIINNISKYFTWAYLPTIKVLIPKEFRDQIDEMIDFMPELYYNECKSSGSIRPEKEHVIGRSPEWSCNYALFIIRDRWSIKDGRHEKERIIGQSPFWSYNYAHCVIKGRWPLEDNREEKERVISRDPQMSYLYACWVLNGRWPEGDGREEKERIISQCATSAYWYAQTCIKGRWPEGPERISVEQGLYELGYGNSYARVILSYKIPGNIIMFKTEELLRMANSTGQYSACLDIIISSCS